MIRATKIEVRAAREDEQDVILDLLTEAANWLRSKGIHQWPSPFPSKYMERDLRNGDTYLAVLDGKAAGTITLKTNDPRCWPDAPEDALYVHRVAIRRQQTGLGDFLISWAERRAHAQNKTYLRLDCWNENQALRHYYEQRGFTHQGDIQVVAKGQPWSCALYEKRISY